MAFDGAMPAGLPVGQQADAITAGNRVSVLVPRRASARRVQSGQKLFATRRAREKFLDALTRLGDPAKAAAELRLSLGALFRLRAEDAAFAAEWHAALGFAWERVEQRVLGQLLDPAVPIDLKLVQAVVAQRLQDVQRAPGRRVDGAAVARLRAELEALTAPDPAADS